MPIKVNISLSAGGQSKPVSSRTLDKTHLTIGRDKDCSVMLEDTQKHVSRVHAELDEEAGTYWMSVVSKVNPVMVNGKRHMFGDRVALADGDVLTIGLYKLEVLVPKTPVKASVAPPAADNAEDMTYIAPARSKAPPPADIPAAPAPAAADTSREDMTYVPQPRAPAPPPASILPASAEANDEVTYIPPVATSAPPEQSTPDEEITFVRPANEMTNPLGRAAPAAAPPPVEEDFSDEMTYVGRPSPVADAPKSKPVPAATSPELVEEDFSEEMTYVRRPAPAPAPAPKAPQAPQAKAEPDEEADIELDLDLDLSDGMDFSEDATVMRSKPKETPAPTGGAKPPAMDESIAEERTQVRPAAPASAPAQRAGGGSAEQALQAFLEGAGLAHLKVSDPEGFLRDSGMMARTAIEGILMLMLASTGVKKSFGVEPEGASDDNPFKTMSDPARMITFLFDPAKRTPDGIDPVQALGDTCSDLRVHQIALMATMHAAVLSALRNVDPAALEREQGGNLGGLNLTRKSKLWDLSVAHHEKFALEVSENINRIFGPDVLAAYMAEVQRFRGAR